MDSVLEVLESMREETESTHWCIGHYETTVQLIGTPEEMLEWIKQSQKSRPRMWYLYGKDGFSISPTEEPKVEDVASIFKIQHCLVGMVNARCGVVSDRVSSVTLDTDPNGEVRMAVLDRVGTAIFGSKWDPRNKEAVLSEDMTDSIEAWNDRDDRTREDILDVLDRAIAAQKGGS